MSSIPTLARPAAAGKVVYASAVPGVALDCDPATHARIGGGTPTNDTTALNTALAAATETAPLALRVDGFAAIHAAILPDAGHVAIEGNGWDTGFYSLPGTNDCTIRKADSPLNPFDPGGTPPAQAGSVILAGLKVDGGRGTYPNGNVSTLGSGYDARGQLGAGTDGPIYPAIDLFNLTGVILDQVWVYDACVFAARFGNTKNIFISNSRFESPGYQSNTDGPHFDGYCSDIHIVNVHGETGDDMIAFNAEEGHQGPITRACVSNVTLNGCSNAIRVDGKTKGVAKVVASNLTGDVVNFAVVYGLEAAGSAPIGTNESFRLANSDISVAGGGFVLVAGSGNSIELDGVTWTHPTNAISWFIWNQPVTVCSISVRSKLIRNATGNAAAYLFEQNQGTCNLLRIEDYAVIDQTGSSYAAIPYLLHLTGSASIGRVWIGSLDANHHGAFTNDFTKIGSIAGPGVLSCGFAFPDGVMANGTPYIGSDHSNVPCIKLGGTVYAYGITPVGAVVKLLDNFTGTAGTTLVGRVPDTTQNGSDVWGDGSGLNVAEGILAIASGGGATSSGITGDACWAASQPLTGVSGGIGTYAIDHTPVNAGQLDVFLRANASGSLADYILVALNSTGQDASLIVVSGGSAVTSIGPVSTSIPVGSACVLEVDLAATTVTVKVNGSTPAGMGAVTIPSAPTLSRFYIRQENGAAGDLVIHSVEVQV